MRTMYAVFLRKGKRMKGIRVAFILSGSSIYQHLGNEKIFVAHLKWGIILLIIRLLSTRWYLDSETKLPFWISFFYLKYLIPFSLPPLSLHIFISCYVAAKWLHPSTNYLPPLIHLGMGDEKEVLGDSILWAGTNIKGMVESLEDYAGFSQWTNLQLSSLQWLIPWLVWELGRVLNWVSGLCFYFRSLIDLLRKRRIIREEDEDF